MTISNSLFYAVGAVNATPSFSFTAPRKFPPGFKGCPSLENRVGLIAFLPALSALHFSSLGNLSNFTRNELFILIVKYKIFLIKYVYTSIAIDFAYSLLAARNTDWSKSIDH